MGGAFTGFVLTGTRWDGDEDEDDWRMSQACSLTWSQLEDLSFGIGCLRFDVSDGECDVWLTSAGSDIGWC